MAEKVFKKRVDDLDPTRDADETIPFSWGRRHFEIDLTDAHAAEFKADMQRWMERARPVQSPATKRSKGRKGPAASVDDADIREWAIKSGLFDKVPDRGRINRNIVAAYNEAHQKR